MFGNVAGYNDIANTATQPFGTFRNEADKWNKFFRQRKTENAMDEAAGDLATAVGGEDYAKAAKLATNAGDYDRAMAYAKLANDKQAQLANAAYKNELVGLRRDQAAAAAATKQAQLDAKAAADADMRSSAISAVRDLKSLADSGEISNLNKSTDNWLLSSTSSKNLGRRTAALSALLPMTNAIARASGGSGINTLGEMMAYLGIPENATSAQIAGALPGLMSRLGITKDDIANIGGNSNITIPNAGMVDSGFVFLGGDPSDPNNWVPVAGNK